MASSTKPCYNMDKKKEVFWHATLKGRTTEITVGKKGKNPKHYPKVTHASPQVAARYLEKVIEQKKAVGYTLRKDRSIAKKHWTYAPEDGHSGH